MTNLLTVREADRVLKKRPDFVREEIVAGRLRAVKLGECGTRIAEDELNRYLDTKG